MEARASAARPDWAVRNPNSQPVRLLVAEEDENAGEALLGVLRNAAFTLRTQYVEDTRALRDALQRQPWDIVLLHRDSPLGELRDVVTLVREFDAALPIIVLDRSDNPAEDAANVTAALRDGATDVVPASDRERLLLVFRREWDNVRERARLARAQSAFDEIEHRIQLLLTTSEVGIAYVLDGMHVFANDAYMRMFGYSDVEDLLGATMLDLVPVDAQDALKQYLRSVTDTPREPLRLRCQHRDGVTFDAEMAVESAVYDGEACWQIALRARQPLANVAAPSDAPQGVEAPAAADPLELLQHDIETFHAGLLASGTPGCIAALQWTNQAAQRGQLGLSLCAAVNRRVDELMREAFADPHRILRVADDLTLLLLRDASVDVAGQELSDIAVDIAEHCARESHGAMSIKLATSVLALPDELSPDLSAVDALLRQLSRPQARPPVNSPDPTPPDPPPADPPPTDPPPRDRPDGGEVKRRKLAPAEQQQLTAEVERCLKQNAFTLMFQPVISVRGDADELYETFLYTPPRDPRTDTSPQLLSFAELAPDTFAPELYGRVDRWLVLQSIKLLSTHRANGHDSRLIINVSAASVADPGFVEWLGVAIRAARLPADALVLQVCEADATADLPATSRFNNALSALHCRSSLSHFTGCGDVRRFVQGIGVDFVKLDSSLIDAVQTGGERKATLARLIEVLQNSGKLTIVPMVESASLLATLWQAGANYIQGHYLQEPSPEMDYQFGVEE